MLNAPAPPAEEEAARPPWHWVGFGAAAIFATWLPLAYLGELAAERIVGAFIGHGLAPEATARALSLLGPSERQRLVAALLFVRLVPLVVAALGGGFLVGRLGAAGWKKGALAGAAVATVAVGLATVSYGMAWSSLIVYGIAPPMAALGALWGGRPSRAT